MPRASGAQRRKRARENTKPMDQVLAEMQAHNARQFAQWYNSYHYGTDPGNRRMTTHKGARENCSDPDCAVQPIHSLLEKMVREL